LVVPPLTPLLFVLAVDVVAGGANRFLVLGRALFRSGQTRGGVTAGALGRASAIGEHSLQWFKKDRLQIKVQEDDQEEGRYGPYKDVA
jgi:hypothetical protein